MQSAPSSQQYVVGINSHNRIQQVRTSSATNTISILDTVPQTDSATTDPYNATNNVAIPTSLTQNQMVEVTLSSVAIPKTQYTVESLWNRLFVSEQIELIVPDFDSSRLARTQFTLELSDGAFVTAQLPPYLNPITNIQTTVDGAGLTTLVFTTALPHGLALADFWNWGDPMRLVSIGITDQKVAILNSSNTSLSIISDTMFQLSGLAATQFTGTFPVDGSGYFGYVLAPGIPGPVYLAQIVTAALNSALDEYAADAGVLVSHVRIYYNLQMGLFVLDVDALPISPTQTIIDPVAIGQGFTNNPTLAYIMGFGNCCIPNSRVVQNIIATNLDRGHPSLISKELPKTGSLTGSFGPLFRTFIDLDIGDYNSISSLGYDIELNWNRFWFDPSCTMFTVTTYRFVFVDACGVCYEILIPFGQYTPEQFAQFLQTQMNAATSTDIYRVSYSNCGFTFSTTNDTVFGLKFGDTPFIQFNAQNDLKESIPVQIYQVPQQFATIAVRMGFDNVDYRGQSSYTSIRPVCAPLKQLVCTEVISSPRRFQFVTQWRVDGSSIRLPERRRFAVYSFTPTLNGALLTLSDGQLLITTPLANGLQVDDIVKVTTTSGTSFYLRVVSLLDPFRAVLDVNADILAALGVVNGGDPVAACVENAALPVVNLYLSQNLYNSNISSAQAMATCTMGVPCNPMANTSLQMRAIAPRLLGMGNEDVLWQPSIGFPIVGVADVNLNFPDSLLIVISLDNGTPCATHTSHLWRYTPNGADNNGMILAIVPWHHHNTVVWERFVPSVVQFSSSTKTGIFKFVILNPDHTLYQLHNVDWSATLNVQVVQASGQLLST